jgi:hypothetical protein
MENLLHNSLFIIIFLSLACFINSEVQLPAAVPNRGKIYSRKFAILLCQTTWQRANVLVARSLIFIFDKPGTVSFHVSTATDYILIYNLNQPSTHR